MQRIVIRLDEHVTKASVDPNSGDVIIEVNATEPLWAVLSDTETFDLLDGSSIVLCDNPNEEEDGISGVAPIIQFEVFED